MKKILDKLMQTKELCEIHTSFSDNDAFCVGYVIATDDYFALFQMISPSGTDDGIYLQAIENISVINIKSEYLAAIKKLMKKEAFNVKLTDKTHENCMRYMLNKIKDSKQICTIYVDGGWAFSGKIEEIDEDIIKLLEVKVTGRENGFEYLRVDDIESICIKSCDEQKIQFLNVEV